MTLEESIRYLNHEKVVKSEFVPLQPVQRGGNRQIEVIEID